jgi:hypothetical protein
MNDLDALSVIHLIANSWESSDFFEIHSITLRSVFMHQRSCRSFSSSSLLIVSLRFVLSHFRWSESLINDRPPPPASPCSEEYDLNLWSEIHRPDCYITQSRFGTVYNSVPTTLIVYFDQITDRFLWNLLDYSLLIDVTLDYLFNFVLISIFFE